jgi:UDP-N-acetylglucosamine--N-acetylmuramyl-(pentapeptide) pyrophosphoryl-undecaprenol N-acetylglucosamine transferase
MMIPQSAKIEVEVGFMYSVSDQKNNTMRTYQNQQQKNIHVVFTGGGTGGHVYPGLAIYEAFQKLTKAKNLPVTVMWVGSTNGIERSIVESKGIRFIGIPAGKLRRYFSLKNLLDIFKVVAGIMAAVLIMMRYRPRVLFSKGGYVSVPPAVAAWIAKVPVITHESDFDPGLATRINARFAEKVFLSYAETSDFFPEHYKPKLITAGNPVRPELLSGDGKSGRDFLSFRDDKPILLVLGGSQGAAELNKLVWNALRDLLAEWNVVHQTGADDSGPPEGSGYRRYNYLFDEYADVFAAADLVLCRSGATTLTEIAALAKPSILLPLGLGVSRGDQIKNAQLFLRAGASYILHDTGSATELLSLAAGFLQKPGMLTRMGQAAAAVFKPDAAEYIATVLLNIVTGESGNEI